MLAETKVRYRPQEFQVIERRGGYVLCAITGKRIELTELIYWSLSRQEPYVDAYASVAAEEKAAMAAKVAASLKPGSAIRWQQRHRK